MTDSIDEKWFKQEIQQVFDKGVRVIYEDALKMIYEDASLIKALKDSDFIPPEITGSFLKGLTKPESGEIASNTESNGYELTKNYDDWEPASSESFVQYFVSRYQKVSSLLWKRQNLKSAISIVNVNRARGDRERAAVIGMVKEVRELKSGKKIIEIEDPTGVLSVLLPPISGYDEIVPDEVLGVVGRSGRDIIFAEELVFPDVPISNDWPDTGKSWALFISDLHIGSKKFNREYFDRFVEWLNKEKKVKYLFIAGDLVDGIGMYKGQQNELDFESIEEEYNELAEMLSKIRDDLTIFAGPGNHDASRDSEPQPPIPKKFAEKLYSLKNIVMVSSPAWITVEGISVLMYHGTSLDGFIDSIESIKATGYNRPTSALRVMIKKRHLAPLFGRGRTFPDQHDFLVIDPVPHILHTGHIHFAEIGNYRGIRLISSGTFQEKTEFQEKLGHNPTPGLMALVNLKTGKTSLIDFSKPDVLSQSLEN